MMLCQQPEPGGRHKIRLQYWPPDRKLSLALNNSGLGFSKKRISLSGPI